MSKVYIAAAKRTAIGKFLGTLTPVKASDLAAEVLKNIISAAKIINNLVLDIVI